MSAPLAPVPAQPRRLAFLGTPEAAVPALRALVAAGRSPAVVVTRPDRRRGRRAAPTPSPVGAAAAALGLPVAHDRSAVLEVDADLAIIVAFGQIIPRSMLEVLPMINLHFSLLPRWRGAAPVERALLAGDTETGVCVMGVAEGLDEGPVYARAELPIGVSDTAAALRDRLSHLGADLLVQTLAEGLGEAVAQQGEVTYAAKIGPDDLRLDWDRSSEQLSRIVRVGGAWTTVGDARLKVWEAETQSATTHAGWSDVASGAMVGSSVRTGDGWLRLVVVQPEGRARQDAQDWLRGARRSPTDVLGR